MKLIPLLIIYLSLTPTVYAETAEIDREKYIYWCFGDNILECEDLEEGDTLIDINAGQVVSYCDKDEPIIRSRALSEERYLYSCIYNGKKFKLVSNIIPRLRKR